MACSVHSSSILIHMIFIPIVEPQGISMNREHSSLARFFVVIQVYVIFIRHLIVDMKNKRKQNWRKTSRKNRENQGETRTNGNREGKNKYTGKTGGGGAEGGENKERQLSGRNVHFFGVYFRTTFTHTPTTQN